MDDMTATTQDTTQPGITLPLDEQIKYAERLVAWWETDPHCKAILASLIRLREIEGKLRDTIGSKLAPTLTA